MKKRLSSSDSLGALMSICPTSEERSPRNNHVYGREFQCMLEGLDEEGCVEESGQMGEKKRRLSVEQVKALEKNFEVENKLEPERKVKLAQELGLQPRQVAVWFQNRRARWKTKQLERDYGVLKANYEALKLNCDTLQHDNDALRNEIREIKEKLQEENTESNLSVKEEDIIVSDDALLIEQTKPPSETPDLPESDSKDLNMNSEEDQGVEVSLFPPELKDGSSESDSSAILTEDNSSPNAAISSSSGLFQNNNNNNPFLKFNCSSSSSNLNCFAFQKSAYQPAAHGQIVKMEEHNFFGDEACTFFSDDQAPTLHWYTPDQWNLN